MRIMIKGGVWKNTEDEILKAAVMKYGKNQWARISSLLVRKSAKQCKARWYEWLDPSIKKPSGRVRKMRNCCISLSLCQHNGALSPRLLEEHQHNVLRGTRSFLMLRATDIMIANLPMTHVGCGLERLIRTQSQNLLVLTLLTWMKMKEKCSLKHELDWQIPRERKQNVKLVRNSLEEARRLASLQKRRELKAAGIQTVKRAKRVRGIDYNAEIPFEIKPVPGPYSTDMEFREHLHQSNVSFAPSSLTEYEKPHKKDLEDQLMKEDVRQQRSQDRKTTPSAVQQLRALVVSNTGKHKRKLELPPPNVHVSGLENLINLDRPESRFMGGKNSLVDALVSLHHEVPAQCTSNSISASVSVEGQLDSTSLKHSGRPTVPDKIPIYDTARTELECFHSENAFSETPIRDTLQINNVDVLQDEPVFKTRDRMLYDQLSDRLTSLPAPNNDYHVVVPDILKGGKHSSKLAEIGTSTSADLAPNTTRKSLHTTETTHRCLPKISIGYMGDFISRADVKSTKASALIATELADIVRHDTDHGNYDLESKFTKYDEIPGFGGAEIAAASELIFREATSFGALLKGEKEMECSHLHASCARTADSDDVNRIIHLASGKFFDGVSAFIAEHNRIEGFMLSDSRLAAKLESKVGRLIAGHVKRTGKLNEKFKATCSLLAVAKEEYLSYMQLETHEVKICTDRVYMLSKFKALVEIREGELQLQFRALLHNA